MASDKYIDCLRDDATMIKSEIIRRSNLQRYVLAVYIAVIGYMLKESFVEKLNIDLLILTCIVSFLVQIYINRERIEIKRLGLIIKEKIAPILSNEFKLKSNKEIYHSETNSNMDYLPSRRIMAFVVDWLIYVFIPGYFIVKYLVSVDKKDICMITALLIVFLILILTTYYFEHILTKRINKNLL